MVRRLSKQTKWGIGVVLICALIIGFAVIYGPINSIYNLLSRYKKPQEHWIVVFVHGNFNTGFGLLSIKDVFQDSLKGSLYAKATRKMRKDPFFFQEQPILQKGLREVTPSFDHPTGEFKYAVYPLLSAYQMVAHAINPYKEELHFYTFGWSGLMSQTVRLKEALRFYNALIQEIEKYKARGIEPSIRIIAHSHGGNVSLNLAAINEALTLKKTYDEPLKNMNESSTLGIHEKETLKKSLQLLEELPKEPVIEFKGQKQFDYHPKNESPLCIDELIVLGTPIQPETSHLIRSRTFKNIYNFYSEGDIIQMMDFISSKKCQQRFAPDVIHENAPHLVEAKILVERVLVDGAIKSDNRPWWKKIVIDSFFTQESKDPTHKDLWFLGWNKDFTQPRFPLNPLPVVVIVPLLMAAANKVSHLRDIDLNLRFFEKFLTIEVTNHNDTLVQAIYNFDISILKFLKEQLRLWKPDTLSRTNVFEKMRETIKPTDGMEVGKK